MKKILVLLFLLPTLNNCTQYSSIIGPTITLAESGNVLRATSSLSSSLAMNNLKQGLKDEINENNYCQTVHSSELSKIFFETLEHSDCYYDPMSIYR